MLLEREVLFFGGKGGVGKTTLASAFALLAAEHGRRTLLVSTDPAHSTGDILELDVGAEPREVLPRLWALEIDPVQEADRYVADVKARIADTTPPRLMAEVERQIDIARVSPGAEEAALFERVTRLIDDAGTRYDRLVFDTAPLGHTLRLLSLPEQMGAWMSGLISRRRQVNTLGRMWRRVAGAAAGDAAEPDDRVLAALEQRQARFARARQVLTDARRSAFVLVATPERLPLVEAERAVRALDRYGIPVGAVFLNRVLPDAVTSGFGERRREREAQHLDRAAATFADHPVYRIPLLDTDIYGLAALRRVVASLPERERAALR